MVQTSQQTKSRWLAALVVTLCRIWQVAVQGEQYLRLYVRGAKEFIE